MKKLVMITVFTLLMVSVLTGCGGNTNSPNSSSNNNTGSSDNEGKQDNKKEQITLTYMASQDWIKDAEMQLAEKFEEETGIRIDYQIVPADQYQSLLKTKLNVKEAPDIFGGQSGKFDLATLYNVEENVVDLSDQEWVQREEPLSLEQATWKDKVYALTIWDPTYEFYVVYNKEIFAELGLNIPTTYEEFLAVCEAIQEAGKTPIYEPVSDGWHHVLWFPEIGPQYEKHNPGLIDQLNTNDQTFANVPIMEKALTQLNELVQAGYMGENYLSDTFTDTEKKMASGEYAMTLHNLGLPGTIEKAYPEVKADTFGFFPIPLVDNDIMYIAPAAPSKFIYSGSENIDAAKQYFEFLTRPENLQFYLDNETRFLALNFEGVDNRFTEEQQAFFDAYGDNKGTVLQTAVKYVNPQWGEIGKDLSSMFIGKAEPADVLKNIDKRRAEQATAAKDTEW